MFRRFGYALAPLTLAALVVVAIPAAMLGADTTAQAAEQQAVSIKLTIPGGGAIEVPTKLSGRWNSDVDSSWGGGLYIRNLSKVAGEDASFEGEIKFANSNYSCWGYHPFTGAITAKAQLRITTDLGGECGKVIVKLSKDGKKWRGTYEAEFPDNGDVTLSPS